MDGTMLTMCHPFGALEYDSPCPHHFRGGLPCVVPTGLRATRCDFAARRQESNLLRDKLLTHVSHHREGHVLVAQLQPAPLKPFARSFP